MSTYTDTWTEGNGTIPYFTRSNGPPLLAQVEHITETARIVLEQ